MINLDFIADKLHLSGSDLENVRNYFSIENKNAHFIRQKCGYAAKRLYAITNHNYCDVGLYWDIIKYCNQQKIPITVSNNLAKRINLTQVKPNYSLSLTLRDYQQDVVSRATQFGCGICKLGTGAGKTLITAALIESYFTATPENFLCILLVPDVGLVEQTFNEFISYNPTFTFSKWSGKNKLQATNVIICTLAIFQARHSKHPEIFGANLLICDEVHKIKPRNSINKLIKEFITPHKFGFTGTLPPDKIDEWSIISRFGPVIYEKNSAELRSEGVLTNCEVNVIEIEYNSNKPRTYNSELEFIYKNDFRNTLLKTICDKIQGNTLILVNHLQHCDILQQALVGSKQIVVVKGSVPIEEREAIKQLMENNNDVVCIAISAIFSTGISIKNISNIILAIGGKSFIRIVQSIGRGLRLHENKLKLKIIDICDRLLYAEDHATERQAIYRQEKIPYKIKILKQT